MAEGIVFSYSQYGSIVWVLIFRSCSGGKSGMLVTGSVVWKESSRGQCNKIVVVVGKCLPRPGMKAGPVVKAKRGCKWHSF